MFKGIEHTAIATPNPERLAQWYVDVLGFRINYRYGPFVFAKAPDGSMLEFIPSSGEVPGQTLQTPGIRHLAIAVDDFDLALEDLKQKNVSWVGEPRTSDEGNRLAFFEDGDGNYVHIIQRAESI
ncbi:MAG: VOC family protein [Bryobacterales bacterium]|nr:VOC family protein [Bryobacterales bacterium]